MRLTKVRKAPDRESQHSEQLLPRRGLFGKIQKGNIFRRGDDQEKLCEFLLDARIRLSRSSQRHLADLKETDAGQIVFQFHDH